jgi:hypothetical protein
MEKMTLYQILDERNLKVNEFQQREMAQCHLDIVKELSPDHSYYINVGNFEKNYSSSTIATHLIENFG